MSAKDFLRMGNECTTDRDKVKFKKLVELLSKDDTMPQLEQKATTCYTMIPDKSVLNKDGLKTLYIMKKKLSDKRHIKSNQLYSDVIGGKRKSKKRHYKHIVKMKTTKTTRNKTLRNKMLKRRRSKKRDMINRRKSRKINLHK